MTKIISFFMVVVGFTMLLTILSFRADKILVISILLFGGILGLFVSGIEKK